MTDVVMANRMSSSKPIFHKTEESESHDPNTKDHESVMAEGGERNEFIAGGMSLGGPLAILTTGVWKRESTLARSIENFLAFAVENWVLRPQHVKDVRSSFDGFLRTLPEEQEKQGFWKRLFGRS